MVNGADDVCVERKGRIERAPGEGWEDASRYGRLSDGR
jgi:hypothetical protein